MVVTLHACDTATDHALYHAVLWDAEMIFSVPCCQKELNGQIKADDLALLTRYGIVKERFSAGLTDALRANLLAHCGYKTQLLEFVDWENTPKNTLIRAVKSNLTKQTKQQMLLEVDNAIKEFGIDPTLLNLLEDSGKISR